MLRTIASAVSSTSRWANVPAWCGIIRIFLGAALFLSSASHAPAAPAVTIGPVVASFELDGAVQEWAKQPPALTLISKGAGARPGKIWLAQSSQGLVIAGRVEGPPPVFAKSPEDMPNGDHVEIWIALADDIPLPPVGWYHKFGMTGPGDEDNPLNLDPDRKVAWLTEQQRYRRQLLRLFVRQWQLAPNVAVETYARPAFAALPGATTCKPCPPAASR